VERLRLRVAEERRARRMGADAARDLTPPPPSRFGGWGEGSVIGTPSRITRPDRIFLGPRVVINEHAWLSVVEAVPGELPTFTVGEGCLIDRLLHIACAGEITIGKFALIGERVLISDTFHQYEDITKPSLHQPLEPPRPVHIGDGVGIGLGACIMPGVTIGDNAYVAAGSVVNRDVPDRSVAVGNPARVVRRYNDETGSW
jgi:acetyltransferase-like isoleucine patch superfamily enzyme